jgi:molybdopterin synthase catalytic subunit
MKEKIKNIFIEGPVTGSFIGEKIASHQLKTAIGGHSIFLGQVRADTIQYKTVAAIEYSSYSEMALSSVQGLREAIISKYALTCMHVYHSLGKIKVGEICFFVFTSAPHRKAAIDACAETVERFKAEIPVWGKEIFEDDSYQWKVNQSL